VRAVVLDAGDHVLLVRFDFPDKFVWAPPGGGIDQGETPELAIVRELAEESGLHEFELGPCVWTREHRHLNFSGWGGQAERIFLVRTDRFEPAPLLTAEQLGAEGIGAQRWFSLEELAAEPLRFAPRRLPSLLADLVEHGPPPEPIDVGV
jgi:8-oxo-dGTP diphosphatase